METVAHIKLAKHIRALGVRQCAFADYVGTTSATVSRWLNKGMKPSDPMKRKLEKLTGGAVLAADWLVPLSEDAA